MNDPLFGMNDYIIFYIQLAIILNRSSRMLNKTPYILNYEVLGNLRKVPIKKKMIVLNNGNFFLIHGSYIYIYIELNNRYWNKCTFQFKDSRIRILYVLNKKTIPTCFNYFIFNMKQKLRKLLKIKELTIHTNITK